MEKEQEAPKVVETSDDQNYEPPAIEKVTSAEELTREVHYAGQPDGTIPLG